MSEQPKSRTIKISQQGTPPPVLQVQYDAIIQHLINIEKQLDYIIAQPRAEPKAEPVAPPEQKMEKSLGVWEQTPQEKKRQLKPDKKKSSKSMIIFLVILGIAILVGIYLAWAYTQGYTFFWNA
jgi:hypothetical protein